MPSSFRRPPREQDVPGVTVCQLPQIVDLLARDAEYRALDGRRIAVLYGDEFDVVIRYAKLLACLGDIGYGFALWANR